MSLSPETVGRVVFGFASTLVYAMVGRIVGRRRASPEGILGIRAFQVWWFGLAIVTLDTPLMVALDQLPQTPGLFTFRVFTLETVLILLMAALGGLLYYLLYVYTGKTWVVWPVIAYTVLELGWLVTLIDQAHLVGYGPGCPSNSFCYEHDVSGTPAATILTYSLSGPIILAAIAYFALYFRVSEPVQKRRIAMVAGGLIVWLASGIVASLIHVEGTDKNGAPAQIPLSQATVWMDYVGPLIGLVASLVIYWAYKLGDRPSEPAAAVPASG